MSQFHIDNFIFDICILILSTAEKYIEEILHYHV